MGSSASCEGAMMEKELVRARRHRNSQGRMRPRIGAMWKIVKRLRAHLGHYLASVSSAAAAAAGARDESDREEHARNAGLLASLLLLRNSLFFMSARENKSNPYRRQLSLALACAYAR